MNLSLQPNTTSSFYTVIGGGNSNYNCTNSDYSLIGGGLNNCIGDSTGGNNAQYGIISGGQQNCIDALGADANYNFIGGGMLTTIQLGSCYSYIIGGQGNTVQHKWATVSGYNVTSVTDCAFHANQFVAQNMQSGTCPGGILTPPLVPPGTLWYINTAPGICNIYIV